MSGPKAVVTGAAGLIGSHVCRMLVAAGWQVTGIDAMLDDGGGNPRNLADLAGSLTFLEEDCRTLPDLPDITRDAAAIIHLSARTSHLGSMTDPVADMQDNVEATIRLLEATRQTAPRANVIFASTRQVFGRPHYLPVDMRHPVCPPDVNAINKLAAEEYLRLYSIVYDLRGAIFRLTNVYGPGMRIRDAKQNFIGVWLKAAVTNATLQIFGDGKQVRDFLYVEDCADLLVKAATQTTLGMNTYLVGGPSVTDLNALAALFTREVADLKIERVDFSSSLSKIDIGDFHGDYHDVATTFGWMPQIDLQTGVSRSLMYYRENLHYYLPTD